MYMYVGTRTRLVWCLCARVHMYLCHVCACILPCMYVYLPGVYQHVYKTNICNCLPSVSVQIRNGGVTKIGKTSLQ